MTDGNGNTAASEPITVTIVVKPKITAQSEDIEGAVGDEVTLSVTASGTGTLTYQWQYKTPTGTSFTNASSADAKSAEWTLNLTGPMNGRQYRCVVTDGNGYTVESEPITITIIPTFTVDDVIYQSITSTTCRVVGYTGNATSVIIDDVVNEKTVTEIGEEAFMGNENLISIDLPDTITVIRARAFKNCTNLREMK